MSSKKARKTRKDKGIPRGRRTTTRSPSPSSSPKSPKYIPISPKRLFSYDPRKRAYIDLSRYTDEYEPGLNALVAGYLWDDSNPNNFSPRTHRKLLQDIAVNLHDVEYNGKLVESMTLVGDKLWSINDEPAIVYQNGDMEWYTNDKLDRKIRPAVLKTMEDGSFLEEWYTNGKLHRTKDEPAVIKRRPNGDVFFRAWYTNGHQYAISTDIIPVQRRF